jgi:hypothetical protein
VTLPDNVVQKPLELVCKRNLETFGYVSQRSPGAQQAELNRQLWWELRRRLTRMWTVKITHEVSAGKEDSERLLVSHFGKELVYIFPVLRLSEVEFKGDGLINMAEETSTQPSIQAVAWS